MRMHLVTREQGRRGRARSQLTCRLPGWVTVSMIGSARPAHAGRCRRVARPQGSSAAPHPRRLRQARAPCHDVCQRMCRQTGLRPRGSPAPDLCDPPASRRGPGSPTERAAPRRLPSAHARLSEVLHTHMASVAAVRRWRRCDGAASSCRGLTGNGRGSKRCAPAPRPCPGGAGSSGTPSRAATQLASTASGAATPFLLCSTSRSSSGPSPVYTHSTGSSLKPHALARPCRAPPAVRPNQRAPSPWRARRASRSHAPPGHGQRPDGEVLRLSCARHAARGARANCAGLPNSLRPAA